MRPVFVNERISAWVEQARRFIPGIGHRIGRIEGAKPFFIVSSGRSGTTLLRRLLIAGGEVHIPPEAPLRPIARLYLRHSNLRWHSLVSLMLSHFEYRLAFDYSMAPLVNELRRLPSQQRTLVALIDAVYRFDGRLQGVEVARWGDKSPGNYQCMEEILAMFPDARFVHAYRDGCDVVASYLRLFSDDAAKCAHVWTESIRAARAFGETHPDIYCEVRYEDLVQNPVDVLRSLCKFLDIRYADVMIDDDSSATLNMPDIRVEKENLIHQPITSNSIGAGRAQLTLDQVRIIEPIIKPLMVELGYPSP